MVAGFGLVFFITYEAGKHIVPLVDGLDKTILAAVNPDTYLPVMDEFIRALTDYSNFLFAIGMVSWMVAYGIYRLCRGKGKNVITGLLLVEMVVVAILAAFGKLWPNKTLIGANVFLVVWLLMTLGGTAYAFYRMDDEGMRRFAGVFWLVAVSIYLTDIDITNTIKETIARPRPLHVANKPWNEHVRVIPEEELHGANSFPSGHTSGTFALFTPIFWYIRNRKARAGLFSWGVLQGFSRVYTAAHFPFCVLMGGFVGFSVGTLVFFCLGGPGLRRTA